MGIEIKLKADVQKLLNEYTDEVLDSVVDAVKETTDFAEKQLKATSPKRAKKGGKYARGWKSEIEAKGNSIEGKVYNKKYSHLTHLLENGHCIANGTGRYDGFVGARVHIAPVNEAAQKKLAEEIERRLSE